MSICLEVTLSYRLAFHQLGQDSDFYRTVLEPGAQSLGFPSAQALSQALADFLQAHKWAFSMAVKAHRIFKYGHDLEACRWNKLICCHLVCNGPKRDPTHAFGWDKITWKNIDEWLAEMQLSHLHSLVTETYRKARRSAYRQFGRDPRYIGTIPVCFTIEGLPLILWHMMPQYSPKEPLDPTLAHDSPWARDILDAMAMFCLFSVKQQIVLHCPPTQDGRRGHALPGHLVRSDGNWVWEPYFDDWLDHLAGRVDCPGIDPVLEVCGHPPAMIMDVMSEYQ